MHSHTCFRHRKKFITKVMTDFTQAMQGADEAEDGDGKPGAATGQDKGGSAEEPGEKEPGEKESVEKEPGEKEGDGAEDEKPGKTAPGEEVPGEEEPSEKEPGEKKPGEKKPGEEEPSEKEPGEEDPGAAAAGVQPYIAQINNYDQTRGTVDLAVLVHNVDGNSKLPW